jgi:predicted DNA-binding transcriptional regulator AlpA
LNAEIAKKQALPSGVLPRGLSRTEAARYVGISPVTFDRMVRDGLMPKPVRIYGRVVWDARAIDAAFDALDSAAAGDQDDRGWSKATV